MRGRCAPPMEPRSLPLLQLVAEGVHFFGQPHRVVVEGDLVDEQGIAAGDERRVALAQLGQAQQGLPLGVDHFDRLAQRVLGDLSSRKLLEARSQAAHLFPPQAAVGVRLTLRQLHHVHGLEVIQDLVVFLLAVAGGLAHQQVAGLDVRAYLGQLETQRGLDEGADVTGQVLLGLLGGDLGPGTEAHADAAGGDDQLLRHVGAEGPDHRAPRFPVIDQFLDAQPVDLGEHEIEVFHAGGRPSWLRMDSP